MSHETTEYNQQLMESIMADGLSELDSELEAELAAASMESLFGEAVQNFNEGEVVQGKVMEITDDRVLVDIGYKSEGIVPTSEFLQPDKLAVGDVFDFYIEDPENEAGLPVLSKMKADRIKNWEKVQEIYEADGTIEGIHRSPRQGRPEG